jgi:hypothetical protein
MKTLQRGLASAIWQLSIRALPPPRRCRRLPRHGPPWSYSGRDAWEKGASRPPKGALEFKFGKKPFIAAQLADGRTVRPGQAPRKGLPCEADRIGVETLDAKIRWRYEQAARAQTALADLKLDHKPITGAMPVPQGSSSCLAEKLK